jgi:hypothetical protein
VNTPGIRWRTVLTLALLALASVCPGASVADNGDLRRALVGVRVFTAFLAADEDIERKRSADGRLHLLVVHRGDIRTAGELAERLAAVPAIRGMPLAVALTSLEALARHEGPPPAGIFLAEWLPDLAPLTADARRHGTLVFSPVLGDVERGAHGGLHVSDRILPVVNVAATRAAGIRIKPFFLEVAKRYEAD